MKRSTALQPLSNEHHAALVLALRARRASASADAAADFWPSLVQRFAAELEPHFKVEEELLLPALERAGQAALAARTRAEHGELRQCISGESSPATLRRFGELLERHVRFEERELFEVAQQGLREEELAAIEKASLPRQCGLERGMT